MNDPNTLIIDTQNLTKTFKGVNALQSLNLKVPRNSIFGFLGPNGAGKTTTIKLLLGLARPTNGTACIFGMDVISDSTEIRKRVGYLAQDPRYYENMTARETLRFTARFFYNGPKSAIEDRISTTLELVGLEDKADRSIKGFSGGERQRLGIAQAQINYPDLLILDEPAAALDPMGRHDVLEVMERLRKHTTIFYSTHILDDVQKVSDTVAILKKGQLVAQAPIETLLAGNEGVIYSIGLKGETNGTQSRLSNQSWVIGLTTLPGSNGHSTWQVSVSDEAAAEAQLLRLLLEDRQLTVTEFGRKKYDLEEIFMSIVRNNMSAKTSFQMVNEQGWRSGFANLLRRESAVWWRSRRWWINLLIWLALINGMLLAMLSTSGEETASLQRTPEQVAAEARTVFVVMAGMFGTIGVVIAMQGSIIDEKKSGTAAWIMSKPASRPAFILAKLVANVLALFIIMLLVQGVVAYLQLSLFSGGPIALMPFLSGMALLGLHMLFYLTLTLMLGTLFSDRGPVIGIPIGILFAAMFIMGYVGDLALLTPWMIIPSGSFQGLAIEVMLGQSLSSVTPIMATTVWSIIFVAVALWRFKREEF